MEINEFLFGNSENAIFAVLLRTFIMFIIILTFLRILGKRGVKQLSVFELVVILGLGSAAGDPMLYKEIGIINALISFSVIVICYKLLTLLVFKFKRIENFLEGQPVYIIKDGKFAIESFKKETVSKDEFFMELRQQGVFHLGQVEYALLEISGEVSVFFYSEKKIRYGLPILPECFSKIVTLLKDQVFYSCTFCGETIQFNTITECPRCKKNEWVKSSRRKVTR